MERHPSRGFTLVELLVTIAVATILFGVAIPSYNELMERQQSWRALQELRVSLHQARGYAARENTHVTVCRSADGTACLTGSRWSEGWMVFEDPSRQNTCTVQPSGRCGHGGRVLPVGSGTSGGVYITANHFVQDNVHFYPEGFAKASNGTFTACSPEGEILRGMVVAWSGRMRGADEGDNTSC